ncbi:MULTISPECIES: glycosyltransferase family 4 protein [Saccharolobus]|uniref:glycosyltransferase family 4 protein n=1 Tax=Saccharolobus TaxID=2100760 RepID=UPI001F103890|nr:glycosyltransferase family 4 protein [Saccharolobus shibatae]MCH4816830.1 glycosyltransferase family 4 protein [Saccharolobus shibatae]
MRILLAAYEKESSGIASYTLEIAKMLSKHLNITLLSFNDPPSEIKTKINVINFEMRNKSRALPLLTFLLNRKRLEDVVKDFDIVFETLAPWGSVSDRRISVKWGYIGYLKLAYIRTVGLSFPENLGGFPVTLQHYIMDRMSYKKAKYIISFVENSDLFVPPVIERKPIKKYECSGKLRILFASRDLNMPRKNLKVVLEALKHVEKPVELHLVGNGKVKADLSHKIIHHGYLDRNEVMSLMREVDVQVLPSTYEELGFVGLEAYSVGLPLITSNIPSFNSIFKPSPKFDVKESKVLANILNSITCEQLEALGKKEWEYVEENNKIALKRLLELFTSI